MRLGATVLAAGFLLAACSSGSSGGTKADPAADQKSAASINIKQSDFPAGWEGSPPSKNNTAATGEVARLFSCIGIQDPAKDQSAQAFSDTFSQGGQSTASSQVRFTQKASDASTDFKAIAGPKTPGCIEQTFQQAVSTLIPANAGATFTGLKVDKRTVPKANGVNAAGYRATLTVTVAGQQIPVTADLAFVQKGRAEGTVSFIGPVRAVPDDVQTQVITAFEKRM